MNQFLAKYISYCEEETMECAQHLGEKLSEKNNVIALFGTLGVGKTIFAKGLIQALNNIKTDEINSPTFTYLNIYRGFIDLFHFDLYRLSKSEDFFSLGFDDYFSIKGICLIEWAEKIKKYLPIGSIFVNVSHLDENKREIKISLLEEKNYENL